jgi:dTDP-4-dehydrorhamnose 3,5-epimerase
MNPPNFIEHNLKIDGLLEIKLDKHQDERGVNFEGYNYDVYKKYNVPNFLVDSFSISKKHSLRGFHGDKINWKMIHCLIGEIQFYAIDTRENSKTFNNIIEFTLNEENFSQILLPPGVVNAHLCLSDECLFAYKLSHNYAKPEEQIHIKWNNKRFNLNWRTTNPVLSNRDR